MINGFPHRKIYAADLLGGTEHEFVVGMYVAILRRWPDPDGYEYFMRRGLVSALDRKNALQEMASSAEAQQVGQEVDFSETEVSHVGSASTAVMFLAAELLFAQLQRVQSAMNVVLGIASETTYAPLQKLLDGDQSQRDIAAEVADLRMQVAAIRNSLNDQKVIAADLASEISSALRSLIRHEVGKVGTSEPVQ